MQMSNWRLCDSSETYLWGASFPWSRPWKPYKKARVPVLLNPLGFFICSCWWLGKSCSYYWELTSWLGFISGFPFLAVHKSALRKYLAVISLIPLQGCRKGFQSILCQGCSFSSGLQWQCSLDRNVSHGTELCLCWMFSVHDLRSPF